MDTGKDIAHISRMKFLKSSGLALTGLALKPNAILATSGNDLLINGVRGYQIVVPEQASAEEKFAAGELQHYLFEMSKTNLEIINEPAFKGKHGIYLGQTDFAKGKRIDLASLKEDGYRLMPAGSHFIVAGGSGKGVLYGVYGLLDTAGFKKLTSSYTRIPAGNAISLPKRELVEVPFINYRTTSYYDTRDPGYTNWHRLSSRDNWGLFVHTFDALVSPDEYGKSHPEYFSLINGNRQPGTQLCLSNTEMEKVLVAGLTKKIIEKPAALYWSVSQNDNDQHCQCAHCSALDLQYGNVPSGSLLYFINRVAARFPEKIISTLAYWYSRSAPKNIRAEKNVNIMLCNIESRRQKPVFETDPAFASDLKDWGKLTSNILIWDYNIQFANLISPFPNLHTIKPNIKFYTDNNVNSLFMQSNAQVGGEMAALRAYLICKLMWNPELDDKVIMEEFLRGYYGGAAPFITKYIDIMRETVVSTNFPLSIFGDPIDAKDNYLSLDLLNTYKDLFDKAETAVKNDLTVLKRVQIARLPLKYAEIQIGRQEVDTPRSLFKHDAHGRVMAKPEMITLINQFVSLCKKEGVTRVRERTTSPDDYFNAYNRVFKNMEETSLAFRKKIIAVSSPGKSSPSVEGLTDGIFGSWESWSNPDSHWVGYEGEHMDFVLDLGEVMPVRYVNMEFLNAQAQPDWNLLALPKFVTYAASIDGEQYDESQTITNPHNPNPKENPGIASVPVYSFSTEFINTQARYIKVHAENLLRLPSWHIRAGKLCWIYCDEIVVK